MRRQDAAIFARRIRAAEGSRERGRKLVRHYWAILRSTVRWRHSGAASGEAATDQDGRPTGSGGTDLTAREASIVDLVLRGHSSEVHRHSSSAFPPAPEGPPPQRLSQARHIVPDPVTVDLPEEPELIQAEGAVRCARERARPLRASMSVVQRQDSKPCKPPFAAARLKDNKAGPSRRSLRVRDQRCSGEATGRTGGKRSFGVACIEVHATGNSGHLPGAGKHASGSYVLRLA